MQTYGLVASRKIWLFYELKNEYLADVLQLFRNITSLILQITLTHNVIRCPHLVTVLGYLGLSVLSSTTIHLQVFNTLQTSRLKTCISQCLGSNESSVFFLAYRTSSSSKVDTALTFIIVSS
jgi:hypothetical protein